MSKKSAENGQANEFIFVKTLSSELSKYRKKVIFINPEEFSRREAKFECLAANEKEKYLAGSRKSVEHLKLLEPRFFDLNYYLEPVKIEIQGSQSGISGDPRDVVIRQDNYQIGFSLKTNSNEIKGPRLTLSEDQSYICFSESIFGEPSTEEWINFAKDLVILLKSHNGKNWDDLGEKKLEIYGEISKSLAAHAESVKSVLPFMKFILGSTDYYIIKNHPPSNFVEIISINQNNSLGKDSKFNFGKYKVPSKIIKSSAISGDNYSNKTEIILDNGWHFNFRIKNGDSAIKPTGLKFTVSLVAVPFGIYRTVIPYEQS